MVCRDQILTDSLEIQISTCTNHRQLPSSQFLLVPGPPPGTSGDDLTATEKAVLAQGMEFYKFGLGYAIEQATKPSTIGFVLASNPIALMAWCVG
jgi:hypothetical protein